MNTLLRQTVLQFIRSWLHGKEAVSVSIAPPWGDAWSLPIGDLEDEDARDQVEWELQQRLTGNLDDYIYAWQQVNGTAYAVAIEPGLLAFWEDMLADTGLRVNDYHIAAGLIEPDVEQEADLMPLLHLWRENHEQGGNLSAEDRQLSLSGLPTDNGELSAFETTPADDDIIGAFSEFEDEEPNDRRPLLLAAIAFAVILLGATGWIMRDSLFGTGDPADPADSTMVQVEQPVDEGPAEEGVQEPSSDSVATGTEPSDPGQPPIAVTPRLRSQVGETLREVFATADVNRLIPHAVLLQGDEILVEASGRSPETDSWRAAMADIGDLSLTRQAARGGSFSLTTFTMPATREAELSLTQFDTWAADLGMTSIGNGLYRCDRASLDLLFERMMSTGQRPWRLSIHRAGDDRYTLMMMP